MKTAVTDRFEAEFVRPNRGRTLVVGSQIYRGREDRRLRYADAIGVDLEEGATVDWVLDLEEPLPPGLGTFEHIDCLSVLEHSQRPWLLAKNLIRLMSRGATIFVTAPFVWRLHAYPDDLWRFSPAGIRALFPGCSWSALRLCHWAIEDEGAEKIPSQKIIGKDGPTPWFPRTETMGFGRRA
jgi:hypothetical protein